MIDEILNDINECINLCTTWATTAYRSQGLTPKYTKDQFIHELIRVLDRKLNDEETTIIKEKKQCR